MIADILPKLAEFERKDLPYRPRPSAAGPDRCIRQMVYHGLGIAREPLPGRALLVFDDSSWHEELTADWIRKSAYKLHSEQMEVEIASQGIVTKGHIDGIITDFKRYDRLLEHKAINHFTFQRYIDGKLPLDYITQVCLYLRGLQKIQPDITEAILLVKNKNTAQYLEFLIQYAFDVAIVISLTTSTGEVKEINKQLPNITEDAFTKFAMVNDYIELKSLPKRQYEIDHWRCQYCQWGNVCWQNWQEEIAKMATDQQLDEEFTTWAHYYLELNMHIGEMQKEKDELKKKIKDALKERDIRQGRAGDYVITLSVQNRKEYTVAAKTSEMLTIRKPKNKETK